MKRILFTALFLPLILLAAIAPSKNYYNEKYRPQYHFSPERNFIGIPAGVVFLEGKYHLFYQYNPKGLEEGYNHWGHAVSSDLFSWEHLPTALFPDNLSQDKEYCTPLPGSILVDTENKLGLPEGKVPPLLAFYTSHGCGQRIAWSIDEGATWQKYSGNPVIPFDEDDQASFPKVFYYSPGKHYVMILNRKPENDDKKQGFSFYTSEDLINWEFGSHLPGFRDRPDIMELRLNNRPDDVHWVLTAGNGDYMVGNFDGKTFTPESIRMKYDFGHAFAGATTIANMPETDGRLIQIAALKNEVWPEMPFHGQLSLPVSLTLRKSGTGVYLYRQPVSEVETLQGKSLKWKNEKLIPGIGQNLIKKAEGNCLRIKGQFDLRNCESFGFMLRSGKKNQGIELIYNVKRATLALSGQAVPLEPTDNKIILDIFIDRSSVEVFANNGKTAISTIVLSEENDRRYFLFNTGGEIMVDELEITPLLPVW